MISSYNMATQVNDGIVSTQEGTPINWRDLNRASFVPRPAGLLLVGGLGLTLCHQQAAAEPPPDTTQIIVTANKRPESADKVPLSVSALGPEELSLTANTGDLDRVVPALLTGNQAGYGQPHLRGVGTLANGPGVENPVLLYVDGVYYGPMAGSLVTLGPVSSVEVDKGPQGTLFGRNAIGGVIQVNTLEPDRAFSGYVNAGGGSYGTLVADAYVTGAISGNVSANGYVRLSNQAQGYGRNAFSGRDVNKTQDISTRSKWRLTASDRLVATLAFDFAQQRYRPAYVPASGTTPLGGPPYTGPREGLDGLYDPDGVIRQGGVSLKVEDQIGMGTLVSQTAYRQSAMSVSFDGGLVRDPDFALNLHIAEPHRQFTQEFYLRSADNARLTWTVGTFFYWANAGFAPLIASGGLLSPLSAASIRSSQRDVSIAAYAQATYRLSSKIHVTAGLRETYEHRRIRIAETLTDNAGGVQPAGSARGALSFTRPTWRFALDYQPDDREMLYLAYDRGFKSGGFNDDLLPLQPYRPETLDAFQAGWKLAILDGRLNINTSAFYYIDHNFQAVTYPNGSEVIYNGKSAHSYGVDLDTRAILSKSFSIRMSLDYLWARYHSFADAQFSVPAEGGGTLLSTFDASGNRVSFAPAFTVSVAPSYTLKTKAGEFHWEANLYHNSGWYAEPDNRLRQPAYTLLDASIGWNPSGSGLKLTIWGKNLTDRHYVTALASQANGDFAVYAAPRTLGATVGCRF